MKQNFNTTKKGGLCISTCDDDTTRDRSRVD